MPFFGNLRLRQITYSQITDFVSELSNRKLTADAIQQHLVAVRRVFNYAHSVNLIAAVPKFPTIKVAAKPRGHFDVSEYRRLVITARSLIGYTADLATVAQLKRGRIRQANNLVITAELTWLIRFMVNSFVRPSDIKNLQHQHVTIVRHSHTYLRLNLPESKRQSKSTVTMAAEQLA